MGSRNDWECNADGDYWYLVGQPTVTGMYSDEADDHMTYSYTILASISDGAWALSETGDNEAKGTAGTSQSVGGAIEYVGDIFTDGNGAGYAGMMLAMEGGAKRRHP